MVVDDDRRGDRETFANAEEVEVLVDDIVVPVDFAGVGIAGLGADRDGRLQCRDLGGRQFRRESCVASCQVTVSPAALSVAVGRSLRSGSVKATTPSGVELIAVLLVTPGSSLVEFAKIELPIDPRQVVGSREDHRHLLG